MHFFNHAQTSPENMHTIMNSSVSGVSDSGADKDLPTISNPPSPAFTVHSRPSAANLESPNPHDNDTSLHLDHMTQQHQSARQTKAPLLRARSPAVDVVGLIPLKKAPRGNSVKQYHALDSMQGVMFYQGLEVTDEYGTQHYFDVRDKTQGALVSTCLVPLIFHTVSVCLETDFHTYTNQQSSVNCLNLQTAHWKFHTSVRPMMQCYAHR